MAKKLVIAEKQIAGRIMAEVLSCTQEREGYIEGNNYIVTWADGHLIGFQYPEEYEPRYKEWKLSDLPLEFQPEHCLKILPGKEKQFEVIKKLIQGTETDLIINAGDAGREGYLIQSWIYKMAENKKPVKVLWASSLTKEALQYAFTHLHEENEFTDILEEAEARAERDYILGMNYSRLLTKKCSNDITLPYGSCITPLLNHIVIREKEIEEFTPCKTYAIKVEFKEGFSAGMIDPEGTELVFDDCNEAESIKKEIETGTEGTVIEIKQEKKEERAALFNLSLLQCTIGQKYKYTPAQTLQIAQNLYEKRILTYPRTDSQFLTSDMEKSVVKNMECCLFGKFKAALDTCASESHLPDEKYFNDDKVNDHHALIPDNNTRMEQIYQTLNEEERNVFDEIVYSFLAAFARPRVTVSRSIKFLVNGYVFRNTESVEADAGYKLLRGNASEKTDMLKFYADAQTGSKAELKDVSIRERVSSAPSRYTVGTIISMMEKNRIGTSATMAGTIEKLMDEKRPFLALKNGKYYSTALGRMYISCVPEELKEPHLNECMEEKLALINQGRMTKEELLQEIYQEVREHLAREDYKRMSFARAAKSRKPGRQSYKKRRIRYE